jgi:hypothetical protein
MNWNHWWRTAGKQASTSRPVPPGGRSHVDSHSQVVGLSTAVMMTFKAPVSAARAKVS